MDTLKNWMMNMIIEWVWIIYIKGHGPLLHGLIKQREGERNNMIS